MGVLVDGRLYVTAFTKLGTTWIYDVLREYTNGVDVGKHHSYIDPDDEFDEEIFGHEWCSKITREDINNAEIATILRNPETFYQSYWRYRTTLAWSDWPIDRAVIKNFNPPVIKRDVRLSVPPFDFRTFMYFVLDTLPGILGDSYKVYLRHADYVMKTESLTDDLLKLLRELDIPHDAEGITTAKKTNVSSDLDILNPHPDVSEFLAQGCEYTEDISELLHEVEEEAFELWRKY